MSDDPVAKIKALADRVLSESAKRKARVREADPALADVVNAVKSKFGLSHVVIEIAGEEIYRAGKEPEQKNYWDGKLRPSRNGQWSR